MPKKKPLQQNSTKFINGSNRFILETDMCDAFAVAGVDMPKMLFTKALFPKAVPQPDEQRVKEKSNIVVSLRWVTFPDQTSRLMEAAKNGIKLFNLRFLDELGTVVLEWHYKECKILAIDFGELGYEQDGSEEHPFSLIKVEIEFDHFDILIPKSSVSNNH